jgi:exodeoxyribonuclease VII small subunit
MAKQVSIEELFKQIEEAVTSLESGELPIEDALQRFESGLKAMKQARTLLDAYTARLEEVRGSQDT